MFPLYTSHERRVHAYIVTYMNGVQYVSSERVQGCGDWLQSPKSRALYRLCIGRADTPAALLEVTGLRLGSELEYWFESGSQAQVRANGWDQS